MPPNSTVLLCSVKDWWERSEPNIIAWSMAIFFFWFVLFLISKEQWYPPFIPEHPWQMRLTSLSSYNDSCRFVSSSRCFTSFSCNRFLLNFASLINSPVGYLSIYSWYFSMVFSLAMRYHSFLWILFAFSCNNNSIFTLACSINCPVCLARLMYAWYASTVFFVVASSHNAKSNFALACSINCPVG